MNKYLHHILKVILKCFSEILMDLWKFFLLLCIGFIRFKFPLNVRTYKYSQNSFALTLKRTFIDTKYCLFYLLLDIVSPALNTIIEIRNALQSWKFLDSFLYRTMTKGQTISKVSSKLFIWTKKPMKIFLYFCPSFKKPFKSGQNKR